MIKFNHTKRGAELDLKVIINFVYGPQLFEGMLSEAEHVIFFVKFSKQNSRCIFFLVWYNLFVAPRFEVITSGDVCVLM